MIKNKLGITNSVELAKAEEEISKKNALQMFESGLLDNYPAGTIETLCKIHFELFDDIYDFAGKIRTVNLSKGHFRFAPVLYLNEALINIEKMPQNTFDDIIAKYVELNVAHPFREGNGRSGRIWLDHILKNELSLVIDWSKIEKEDYLLAMERSPVRDTEIKELLKSALTDKINDRLVFIKGIDKSYEYEGYYSYSLISEDNDEPIIVPDNSRK